MFTKIKEKINSIIIDTVNKNFTKSTDDLVLRIRNNKLTDDDKVNIITVIRGFEKYFTDTLTIKKE